MTITYYTKNVLPYNCFKFSLDKGFQQFILNKEQSKFHLLKLNIYRNMYLYKACEYIPIRGVQILLYLHFFHVIHHIGVQRGAGLHVVVSGRDLGGQWLGPLHCVHNVVINHCSSIQKPLRRQI